MSANKRPFISLGAFGSSDAPNKRATTPVNQAPANNPPPSSQSPGSTTTTHPYKSTGKNVKTAGYAVLSTLKGSMKLLEGSCRAFSPLHAAAEDLLQVIGSIESTTKGDLGLFEIASELPQWASILSSYLLMADSDPEVRVKLAERLTGELEGLVKDLKAQEERGKFREWLKSNEKAEELRQCYRRIETSFRQLQCDKALHTWKNTQEQLQDLRMEKMSPSHDARYDSSFAHKVKRGECLKNTRVTVLEDSSRWIYGVSLARIFWLNGMAGTGKTTIAYTICSELEQNERLGASFFCSRAASDCQDVNRMIPTIAYQLAQRFYSFRSVLCQKIAKGASLAKRKLSVQFNHLIKEPLLEVRELLPNGVVVVIDALDECSDAEATKLVLELLLENAAQLPVRFFLTSRPDPSIVNTLLGRDPESHSVLHLHNVEKQLVNADIETYLTVSLAQITISQSQIRQLALQAGVLFIYATTLARYILSGHAGANRQTRLAAVLSQADATQAAKKDREIDRLYTVIVGEALNAEHLEQDEVDVMKHVLWIVTTVREPVTRATLAGLLAVDKEAISVALEPLRSVLNLIEGSDVVAPLHASFPEFILNPERSRQWTCYDHRFIAIRCFNVMQNQLRFNIAGLGTSSQLDQEVPDLSSRVKDRVSSELSYACRHWSTHLRNSAICRELLHCLHNFLFEGLLFWMEVLNLVGQIDRGKRMLIRARRWLLLEEPKALEVIELVHDSYEFVHAFACHPVRWSTPHIYLSFLPLTPRRNRIRGIYGARTDGLHWLDGNALDRWYGRTAVSPRSLASNQQDQPKSSHTGVPPGGHIGPITFVALSPDGSRIASGSADKTVRIWDSHDGTQLTLPFKGHTDIITSIAFSPDGKQIVSGSHDTTIRIWGSEGTVLIGPFKGHSDVVTSVAFSPDGVRVVSGSWDRTVRAWGCRKGTLLARPFEGHTGVVTSVAFSPDGARIVSGSWDMTIRIWSSSDGTLLVNALKGHAGLVTSVAFSPDGARIVSGSYDKTVRVWCSYEGAPLVNPLQGHASVVASVAFSQDGAQIVSGSWDKTVRLWGSDGTMLVHPFKGHADAVTSVTFSPDGARVVSGSKDGTIRIWNACGGISFFESSKGDTNLVHVGSVTDEARIDLLSHGFVGWNPSPHKGDTLAQLRNRKAERFQDGWIRDSSDRVLLWIPENMQQYFPPLNGLAIKGAALINHYGNLWLGDEWHKCYNVSNLDGKRTWTKQARITSIDSRIAVHSRTGLLGRKYPDPTRSGEGPRGIQPSYNFALSDYDSDSDSDESVADDVTNSSQQRTALLQVLWNASEHDEPGTQAQATGPLEDGAGVRLGEQAFWRCYDEREN